MLDFLSALKSRREQRKPNNSEPERQRKPSYFKRSALIKGASKRMVARAKRRSEAARERENTEHRANEKSLAESTRVIATFTKVLALVGFLSAIISGFQWRELNSGGVDTHTLAEAANSAFCVYLEPIANTPPEQWLFNDCGDGQEAD